MRRNIKNETPEEKALLSLLRREPLAPALTSCDKKELAALAVRHAVLAPLAARILSEGGAAPPWRDWAQRVSLSAERDALLVAAATESTVDLLEAAGVVPVVLKGPSLALGRPRDAGDVDLLIPERDLLRSIGALEGSGYAYRGFDRNLFIRRGEYRDWKRLARWSNQFEFAEPAAGALVELHTAFFETGRVYAEDLRPLRALTDGFIARAVVDPATGYRFLSLEDRALLLALHAGLKRAPDRRGFVLRHLLDLEALIDAGLDWTALADRAVSCGAAHHLAALLRLCGAFGGPPVPDAVVAGLMGRLPGPVAAVVALKLRCVRGLDSYDRAAIFLYRLVSPFVLKGTLRARLRSLFVFPLFFPPSYTLANIYRLPPRSRAVYFCYLLEPLRWVYLALKKAARPAAAR